MEYKQLKALCLKMRRDILEMIGAASSGHPGGSLSAVELVAGVYARMKVDPKNPEDPDRDRFVLSKGHGAPCYYAVLGELGFFDKEEFKNFRQLHSMLQGHPDAKKVPGVDASTGSLGQGVSIATGMALGAKTAKKNLHVYTLLGDGELQEGQVWEACTAAAHYGLDNLTVLIDNNGLQIDGNDLAAVLHALDIPAMPGRPRCILAHTVKGCGVSFMENQVGWHGKAPSSEELAAAFQELEGE